MKEWLKNIDNVREILPLGYRVDEYIAAGGQGAVYKGTTNGDPSAIKVYFPGQLKKRIEREVNALASISCPSVVKLIKHETLDIHNNEIYVVSTEFIPGKTLDYYINSESIDSNFLKRVLHDVAMSIDAMWSLRIVHRDIKPSNLIVDPDASKVSVIDLGLARHVDESTLTAFGLSWGTMGFLSPEQNRAVKQLTCKSDVFALGILVIQCYLRRHPTNGDQLRLFASGFHDRLPSTLNDWELAPLLKKMLNPKPTIRPNPSEIVRETA